MRKYIISDLHGNGEVYDSIMGFLENVSLVDDVELYINGDLIDRGLDGYRMLEDIIERVNGKGNIKINYLGGNHELMMYQALKERKPGQSINHFSRWMNNGGWVIEGELDALEDNAEEKIEFIKNFLGELKIYKKFNEIIDGNNILLVHAQAPEIIKDECDMFIKDDDKLVEDAVWTREEIRNSFLFFEGDVIGYNRIGLDGYLTIKGHTPLEDIKGFIYNKEGNFLNIDGGCAAYACGRFSFDHVPLVEVKDNILNILVFNHNNQIIDGYYFDGEIKPMDEKELELNDKFIDHRYDCCGEKNKQLIKEINELD